MHVQSAQQSIPASAFSVICDPQGRLLTTTQSQSAQASRDQFCRQFDMPWHIAEQNGYDVYELTPKSLTH